MKKKITVEVSAHHAHISEQDLKTLFGPKAKLHKVRDLSQIGQFAAKESITLKTKAGSVNARIVGPERRDTYVEITRTDAYKLGIMPILFNQLEGKNLATISKQKTLFTFIGPKGQLKANTCVVVSQRHLHVSEQDAKKWKLKNGQFISLTLGGTRALTFDKILVRISNTRFPVVQIDTDEANAAGISGTTEGFISF